MCSCIESCLHRECALQLLECLPLPSDGETKLGHSDLDPCWAAQGGGVYVESGTVSFNACNIHGNLAYYVSARFLNPSLRSLYVLP